MYINLCRHVDTYTQSILLLPLPLPLMQVSVTAYSVVIVPPPGPAAAGPRRRAPGRPQWSRPAAQSQSVSESRASTDSD
jgi:hypothetical protein